MSALSDVIVRWTPETSGRVRAIQVRHRPVDVTNWTEDAAQADPAAGEFRIAGVAPGANVEVQTRFVMSNGIPSPWTDSSILTATLTIYYASLSGVPTTLSQINSSEGSKLGGIAPGADVTANNKSADTNAVGGRLASTLLYQIDNAVAQSGGDTSPPAVPTGLALSSTIQTGGDGIQRVILTAYWNANTEDDLAYYHLEYKQPGGNFVVKDTGNVTSYPMEVAANTTFIARLQAFDRSNNPSGYSSEVTLTSTRDTTPPAIATGLSVIPGLGSANLAWTNPVDTDVASVNIYESTTSTRPTSSITSVFAKPGAPGSIARNSLATGTTYYYWIEVVDQSGNKGPVAGPISATTLTTTVAAVNIQGQLTSDQISSLVANKISGALATSNIPGLDASKITSGTFGGAQIAANAIDTTKLASNIAAPKIFYGANVNDGTVVSQRVGDLIFSTYDRKLYANNTVGAITGWYPFSTAASELTGQITTTQIGDNAISTPKMAANSILGDRITANSLDASKIITDSITAGQIAVGAIGASEIQSGAITASKLAVQAENLNRDKFFQDLSVWTVSGSSTAPHGLALGGSNGWYQETYADSLKNNTGTPRAIVLWSGNTGWLDQNERSHCYFTTSDFWIPLTAGRQYSMSVAVSNYCNQSINVQFDYQTSDKTPLNISDGIVAGSGTGPQTYEKKFTPPVGAAYLNVIVYNGNAQVYGGPTFSGAVFVSNLQFREALGGSVIIDGSLTSTQIAARSILATSLVAATITGYEVAANTITGLNILAGSVNADRLSANSITTLQLGANSITASKIGVTGQSLFPDGQIQDAAWWTSDLGGTSATGAGYQNPFNSWYLDTNPGSVTYKGGKNAWVTNNAVINGSTQTNIQIVPPAITGVIAGETYEARATLTNNTNRPGLYMGLQWFDGSNAYITGSGVSIVAGDVTKPVSVQAVAPANATSYRIYFDLNGSSTPFSGTAIVTGITFRQAASATLIVDGTITGTKIAGQTITGSNILTNSVSADRLQSGTSLPANLTISSTGYSLSTLASTTTTANSTANSAYGLAGTANTNAGNAQGTANYAQSLALNPAPQINANSTTIDPGKVLIAGATTLSDWRYGGDYTQINGGSIGANTVTANKVTIGIRGVSVLDIYFTNDRNNTISWSGGFVDYMDEYGARQVAQINGGSATWSPSGSYIVYVWFDRSYSATNHVLLAALTTPDQILNNPANVILAAYRGGTNMTVDYGRTIIDGDVIKTGTVTADRLSVTSLSSIVGNIGYLEAGIVASPGQATYLDFGANYFRFAADQFQIHSPGNVIAPVFGWNGSQLQLRNVAIDGGTINVESVTTQKLQVGGVTTSRIQNDAVTNFATFNNGNFYSDNGTDQSIFEIDLYVDSDSKLLVGLSGQQSYSGVTYNDPWSMIIYVDGQYLMGRGGAGGVSDVVAFTAGTTIGNGSHHITVTWHGSYYVHLANSQLFYQAAKK